jgi:hypothetical protein
VGIFSKVIKSPSIPLFQRGKKGGFFIRGIKGGFFQRADKKALTFLDFLVN